jgi:hypothetical protein
VNAAAGVQRGDGGQVGFVEAEDARRAIAGGERDQGAVGGAEVKVAIASLEIKDAETLAALEAGRG